MPRDQRITLAVKILELLAKEPWLSATIIAHRVRSSPGAVSSLVLRLSAVDGPLMREHGRGPRGGYGYALRPLPPPPEPRGDGKSRYELIAEEWL